MPENEVIHRGSDYFNEDSAAPFVMPAPAQIQQRQPSQVNPSFVHDEFDPNEDLSQYVRQPGLVGVSAPRNIGWTVDETDETITGRIFNTGVKLKALGPNTTNLLEKIDLYNQLKELMTEFEVQIKEDKDTIIKKLGLA